MIRRKKQIKRVLVSSIFLLFILLANSQLFNSFNVNNPNTFHDDFSFNNETPVSADSYLEDYYITGSGLQQDVRIYGGNNSFSLNNEASFEIPGMSSTDISYLSQGNFNFTFQNNYTTDYIIENTDALYTTDFIKFTYNYAASTITTNIGSIFLADLPIGSKLVDGNPDTYIRFTPVLGILNFTVSSSFSGTTYSRTNPTINLNFNRNYILGLIANYQFSLTNSAYLTLRAYDMINSLWINITEPTLYNSSISTHTIEQRFINENLKYINSSSISDIQFYFQGLDTTSYTLTLREYKLTSTYAFDLPITDNNYVALEFDLKGKSSTVNGFYAWIRTLNLAEAQNTELNVTLYKADSTIKRTSTNLAALNIVPDYLEQIDSFLLKYNNYHGDSLHYFSFNTLNTQNLPLYNYFIVIKSNRSTAYHSLVSIPRSTFGDPDAKIDHELRTSSNAGTSWNIARKVVTGTYTSENLDAALFKINVTRGYMPSDFINPYDSEDTLKIQDTPLSNLVIDYGVYSTSSSLTWGLGQWNHDFTTPVLSNPPVNFNIDLTWNTTTIKGFLFDVNYSARAYWIEKAFSYYNVSYDTVPRWSLNFTLNLNNANLDNWEFLEFWYVYPEDYTPLNLTNPLYNDIYESVFNATGGEISLVENSNYDFLNVSKDTPGIISGNYSLSLTSSNLIYQMHSYINYNDILWETNGFMYGDNISVRLDLKDSNGNPVIGGSANVVLFYPDNNTQYPGAELNSGSGVIKDSSLIFEFNNQSILDVTKDVPLLGNYYLAFFWENGSAIGCKKLKLYIDTYKVDLYNCSYDPILDKNELDGIVHKVSDRYSIFIATINVTNGDYDPNFYAVNISNLNQEYIYEINGQQIPIRLNLFLQNETLLNPDEDVKVSLQLENLHPFVDLNVKLKVQLVSVLNDEWIIDEQTTALSQIKPGIDPNGDHIKDFSTILHIPTLQPDGIWQGLNAPIRKGGVKTRTTIYFEYSGQSYEVGTYESSEYSLLVNETQDDFDGYIIALKHDTSRLVANIIKPFNRNECQYLPEQTTFLINIYDKNYVSSYNDIIKNFSLKLNSVFTNITINPETPIHGQFFNISSDLTTEFGTAIPNENISLQHYNGNDWNNISSQISNINGTTNFEVNSLTLPREEEYTFRLLWDGDIYTNYKAQNFSVITFRVANNISISIQSTTDQIFKTHKAVLRVTLYNIGDSELMVNNISIDINPLSDYSIAEVNYLDLQRFIPGQSTLIFIEILMPSAEDISITFSVETYNSQTKEVNTFHDSVTFTLYDSPIGTFLGNYIMLIMIGIFLIVWGFSLIFRKRMIKKIETPIEEPLKKRPRRGKYVPVSEIPKKEEPEEELEEEEEQKTDLDSLLEEEGL